MTSTQSTVYTDNGIKLQNSDRVLPTNLVVYDASGKKTSVTIEGDLYVAGEIKSKDYDNIPEVNTANSGYLLSNDGSNASWTNGPINLQAGTVSNPSLTFGTTQSGFSEVIIGASTGVQVSAQGSQVCSFIGGGIRLPGGNPIRSNGNSQSNFQFVSDVPRILNSVTTAVTGGSNIDIATANHAQTSLDLVCSNTNNGTGTTNASSMAVEVKNNQIVFSGAGTTASATLPTRVNRMTIDNTQVAVSVPLTCTGNITFSTDPGTLRRSDNVNIILGEDGSNVRTMRFNVGNQTSTRQRLLIEAGTVSVQNSQFVVSNSAVTHSISGQLNLNTAGSAAAPTLLFGDSTVPQSGIYGTDGTIKIATDGVERVSIGTGNINFTVPTSSDTSFIASRGLSGTNGFRFSGLNDSGMRGNTSTNEVFLRSNGNNVISVLNDSVTSTATVDGNLTVTGRATIPDVVYPFDVFTSSGSTADFTLAQSTRAYVRLEMDTFSTILRFPALIEGTFYRIVPFRNGTTATLSFRPANNVIMYMYSGGSRSQVTGNSGGTVGITVLPGTFYECIFSSGSWYVVAQHPIANCALPADVSIAGQLNLTTAGSQTAPALLFGDTTGPSGIYGSDNVINFCTDGTERMRIGQNFNDHYQAVTTNQRFQSPDGDGNGYRFANSGDNRIVCNNNTVSIRSNGVNTLSVTNTGATVTGNLSVTGTISGSISTPQVAKKTVVIASDSSTAYVYDSGNTAPATTLISVSISSQKNITLGNMGQSYDGFEFEFMLLGDLNNFGVAVTLSLAGSFVKVRSGAIGIVGSTAGQVHTFSRPMNEFRITGVFVWNNGTPYWVVVDRGVYKQRATNTKFTGGTYTVNRNTPEDVLLTRASATTIDFKNLVNEPGFQEDYDGFNFWLSFTSGTSNNVSFTNSAPVGGSSLLIIGNSGAQTISPGSTAVVVASGQTSTCLRCVFRDTAGGGHGWFVYGR